MKLPKCPCCGLVLETDAECPLRVANLIQRRPDKIVVAEGGVDHADLARAKVALELASRPGLMLRALVEGWDHVRINRELH